MLLDEWHQTFANELFVRRNDDYDDDTLLAIHNINNNGKNCII